MTSKNSKNRIPKKFQKLKRSFMDNLTLNNDASFKSFPNGEKFHGMEDGENIVLIIRSHWVVYFPQILVVALIWILPWVLLALVPDVFKNVPLFLSLLITVLAIGVSIIVDAFLKWFYNVSIITDQRVIDLDYPNVMSHTMSEAQLEKIEDVTHKQSGALGSVFDFGTVYVQTAGTNQNIEFQNVPRPRDVQDILVDLLESKQKGDI